MKYLLQKQKKHGFRHAPILLNLFFHRYSPGKNSITRRVFHRKPAKAAPQRGIFGSRNQRSFMDLFRESDLKRKGLFRGINLGTIPLGLQLLSYILIRQAR